MFQDSILISFLPFFLFVGNRQEAGFNDFIGISGKSPYATKIHYMKTIMAW